MVSESLSAKLQPSNEFGVPRLRLRVESRELRNRSFTESIDATASGGRLVFQIFGALTEFERSIIQERTNAAIAHGRAPVIPLIKVARRLAIPVAALFHHFPGGQGVVLFETSNSQGQEP